MRYIYQFYLVDPRFPRLLTEHGFVAAETPEEAFRLAWEGCRKVFRRDSREICVMTILSDRGRKTMARGYGGVTASLLPDLLNGRNPATVPAEELMKTLLGDDLLGFNRLSLSNESHLLFRGLYVAVWTRGELYVRKGRDRYTKTSISEDPPFFDY